MPLTPDKVFIYGTFKDPARAALESALSALGVPGGPEIAVEVLREFSATELVGKVYVQGRGGSWTPVSQPGIRLYTWYQDFPRLGLTFSTEGSGPWQVLYFRQESDESGPYVAVGLRLKESPHP